jgi:hypothetical protein
VACKDPELGCLRNRWNGGSIEACWRAVCLGLISGRLNEGKMGSEGRVGESMIMNWRGSYAYVP